MLKPWATIQLLRLDSSMLGFLAVFIPSYTRTADESLSLKRSVPILLICMAAFIANDLDDIDKDRINHPNRPLPTGGISASTATALYFISLGLALLSIGYFVEEKISFWYYGLALAAVSYRYVVESWPTIKGIYVAVTASTPIFIVSIFHKESGLYLVAAALFLLTLGRETCMDIRDRPGDQPSYAKLIDAKLLAELSFLVQFVGLSLLVFRITTLATAIVLIVATFLLASSALAWFELSRYKTAILLMKCQLLVGLYFLT